MPVNKVMESEECCVGMPIAYLQTIDPPDTTPGLGQGTGHIPLGNFQIVVGFDEKPCNVRVTNLPGAHWLIHKWYVVDKGVFLDVAAFSPGGLVHVAVDWHSGGIILKYESVSRAAWTGIPEE